VSSKFLKRYSERRARRGPAYFRALAYFLLEDCSDRDRDRERREKERDERERELGVIRVGILEEARL